VSSQTDRDSRLNNFREKFRKNLDDTNKELRSDIKLILSRDFEDELSKAEFSAKKGHMVDAAVHDQLCRNN
jgi:hypothetical protein